LTVTSAKNSAIRVPTTDAAHATISPNNYQPRTAPHREGPRRAFWITDPARTVVDAYWLRYQIGEDLAHAALREYLRSGRKQTRLTELGLPLRAWMSLSAAMRVLGE
jgi:hypothetical protein